MFENELQDLRRHKWRVDTPTRALFTADDARAFLHDVGFCLEYPLRTPVVAPTFIGAVIGSDQNLPTAKYAFVHPRAREAGELKQRLLAEKEAFEASFGDEGSLFISAAEFPYFYALLGDRNPKQAPSAGERGEKALLRHTFELVEMHGPVTEKQVRDLLGETVSDVALARTLHELWSKLRLVRVGEEGKWDLLLRWAPEMVNQGKQISAQEALSALLSKYLEVCVAVEQKDVEEFFGHIVARSRVAEVIKGLSAAREIGFISVSGRTLLRNVPRISEEEKAAKQAAAAAPRTFVKRPRPERPPMDLARPSSRKQEAWMRYGPPRKKAERRGPRPGGDQPRRAEGPGRPQEGAAAGTPPRREWKPRPTGVRPERKFGTRPPRTEGARDERRGWKPRPRDGEREEVSREWKPRPADASGRERKDAREWKPRPAAASGGAGKEARREWKPRPAGARGPAKFGAKRPWQKSKPVEGAAGERAARSDRPFKKSGPAGNFKKPFQKSFKKPFQKSSRPGSKPKSGGRRPA